MDFQKQLEHFYETESPEELRLQEASVQYLEFLTATRYLERHLPPGAGILDNCAGTGVYAFYLAERGYRVTAGDIVPYNVEFMRKKQAGRPILDDILQTDAACMPMFADGSFQAVLCMGALYHLLEEERRRQTIAEGLRLLVSGGLLACTYMNRHAVILNDACGDLDNIDDILLFAKEGREGVFYASSPEEAQALMDEFDAETVCHVALDGAAALLRQTAGLLTDEGLRRWRRYHLAACEIPSLLGYSYHNMILVRKK